MTAYGYGHHGEILQGLFYNQDNQLQRGLVSLGCSLHHASAHFFYCPHDNAVCVYPVWKTKALRAAEETLKYLHITQGGGHLYVSDHIQVKMGFGSSTCDVVAAIKAVAMKFNHPLNPVEIAKIAVRAEQASDATMFSHCVLFAQRTGSVIESFAQPLPAMRVIGFLDHAYQQGIDTLHMPLPRYSSAEIDLFSVLRHQLRQGLFEQDVHLIGHVATQSAIISQRYLPKKEFSYYLYLKEQINAVGLQVSHSGNLVGFLLPITLSLSDYRDLKNYVVKKLSEKKIHHVWDFSSP